MIDIAMRNDIRDRTYENCDVDLDDNDFTECIFRQTRMLYRGTGFFSFDECTFDRCSWVLKGPAGLTATTLRNLYMSDHFRPWVQHIVDYISGKALLAGEMETSGEESSPEEQAGGEPASKAASEPPAEA